MALHHAADQHALAEAELLDHRAGHEGIGPLAREIGCRVAEEAVAVGVHFQHAGAGHERQRLAVLVHFAVVAVAGAAHAAGDVRRRRHRRHRGDRPPPPRLYPPDWRPR